MTVSKLATLSIPSPNRNDDYNSHRVYPVTRVTIHHMACCWTAQQCGNSFSYPSRKASSNYGIGYDGEIACYVDEDDRAWTSASWDNDNRAITIEVSNSWEGVQSGSWAITQESWDAMIALCADICTRYGIEPTYTGDTGGSFTEHRMFAATGCPGPYIHDRMDEIVRQVKEKMEGKTAPDAWPVWMYESNGTAAQKWIPRKNDDGTISLESVVVPGKYLDVSGGGTADGTLVQIYPSNDTDSQKFYLNQVVDKKYWPQAVRPFEIVPKLSNRMRLDVGGGSDALGAPVQLYKANRTAAQEWYVLDNGDGTWTLCANLVGAKRVLDVKGGGR